MAGKLIEPKVITDYNNKPVCILPTGFYFDDSRWDAIWNRFESKGESLTMDDLRELFPDEPTLNVKQLTRTGEIDFNKPE
ncbi:MAG: hypothetical protein OQK72_03795 [Gammaproteobacteria bacterium]|nr:hypothetical protein [Gammaproteobacteria bacterium]MCW9055569.1 hypothetical protein [Gammaproteobacteria bacterium]